MDLNVLRLRLIDTCFSFDYILPELDSSSGKLFSFISDCLENLPTLETTEAGKLTYETALNILDDLDYANENNFSYSDLQAALEEVFDFSALEFSCFCAPLLRSVGLQAAERILESGKVFQ